MPISRDEVIFAYRFFLNRSAPPDEIIEAQSKKYESVDQIRSDFMASTEFGQIAKQPASMGLPPFLLPDKDDLGVIKIQVPTLYAPQCQMPTYAQYQEPLFQRLRSELGATTMNLHRKGWEWVYIARVIELHGLNKPGKHGLCFAAGCEPLPAPAAPVRAPPPRRANAAACPKVAPAATPAGFQLRQVGEANSSQKIPFRNLYVGNLPTSNWGNSPVGKRNALRISTGGSSAVHESLPAENVFATPMSRLADQARHHQNIRRLRTFETVPGTGQFNGQICRFPDRAPFGGLGKTGAAGEPVFKSPTWRLDRTPGARQRALASNPNFPQSESSAAAAPEVNRGRRMVFRWPVLRRPFSTRRSALADLGPPARARCLSRAWCRPVPRFAAAICRACSRDGRGRSCRFACR